MEFLSASLLWGAAAAGIPVLIHLLGRARPVHHVFPAMRFILRSQKSSSRALKIKHLLVLLLRILALVLIALAFAQPMAVENSAQWLWMVSIILTLGLTLLSIKHREFITGAAGVMILFALYSTYPSERTLKPSSLRGDFVLVLDQSMSMLYVEPENSRFELARAQALQFLDRLSPESRVALILGTETPERVQGRLSYRHDFARQKLKEALPTGRSLDISKSLNAARDIIARDRTPGIAAIIFFTDLQANAYAALADKGASGDKSEVPLIVVDVAGEQRKNGAALEVRLPASVLPAESRLDLNGKIRPVDKDRACLVELYIDEKRVAQTRIEPKGQDVVSISLEFLTGTAGQHTGRLHLVDSDRLPMDQDQLFTYVAGRPAAGLVLEQPANSSGEKGSAFFLKAALLPTAADDPLGMSGMTWSVEPAGELSAIKLANYRVVVLADCGPLSANSWDALQQWTGAGGGLFIWLGPKSQPGIARYGFQPHANFQGLLPGNIGTPISLTSAQGIAISQTDHPLAAHFNAGLATLLRDTKVTKLVKVTQEPQDANANVVLNLGDGTPLLLEKIYGRGRVLLSAIDPGLICSDLPRRGELFVTLVLDAVRLLAGEDAGVRARLGFPFVLTLPTRPADNLVMWTRPGLPTPLPLNVDATVKTDKKNSPAETALSVIVPPIDTPGVHQFNWMPTGSNAPLTKLIAVNAEPSESNLAKVPKETALKALAPWNPKIFQNLEQADEVLGVNSANSATQSLVLLAAMVLIACMVSESFLANRLYRSDTEVETPAEKQNVAG